MNQQIKQLKDLQKAGNITAKALNLAKKIAKPDMPLIEIANKVEQFIEKNNAKPAFPINLSCNEVAAHYSPTYNDDKTAKGLLKIDIGVHVNGFIGDAARSVDLTPEQLYSDMIKANKHALYEAIKKLKHDVKIGVIGSTIQPIAKENNFNVIKNLTGHEIKQYELHAGLDIPNVLMSDVSDVRLRENQVIAIEPFFTKGTGKVKSGDKSCIYQLITDKNAILNLRDNKSRKILLFIQNNYNNLPFSSRWLIKKFGMAVKLRLKILESRGILHNFPILVESSNAAVSQFENTVLIEKDKALILTSEQE